MSGNNDFLKVNNEGAWSFEYAGRMLFASCTTGLEAGEENEAPKLVFTGNSFDKGSDTLGQYCSVSSEFIYNTEILVTRTVKLYKEKAAAMVYATVKNNKTDMDISLRNIMLIQGQICMDAKGTKVLTNDWERYFGGISLCGLEENNTVYSAWSVGIYNKELETGIAAGILSGREMFTSIEVCNHQSGNIYFKVYGDIRSGDTGVLVPPGTTFTTDSFLIVAGMSAYAVLEEYASLVMLYNRIEPQGKSAVGWADWYYYYGNNSQKTVLDNMEAIDQRLKGYGVDYIQVDDGWQKIKSYTRYEPLNLTCTTSSGAPWEANADFGNSMKQLADQIHEKGHKAGLWIRPFSIMKAAEEYQNNLSWVLKHLPEDEMPDRATVDISSDEGIKWLEDLFGKISYEWGYDFIKYDFITYDILSNRNFQLPRNDLGPIKITNRRLTSASSYYKSLKAFRDSVRKDTFLLGCNCLAGSALGVVDGFRISGDICIFSWELTKKMLVSSAYRYYMNGRLWQNDPDVVMVADKISMEKAVFWASFVALAGGMILLGDCIPELPEERIEILRKILPVYSEKARPLRLFEEEYPSIWYLDVEKPFGKWNIVGIFNWEDKERQLSFCFEELSLKKDINYLLFDFWKSEYLGIFSKGYTCMLGGDSCRIISVREAKSVPQVLSTQCHITQGGNELIHEEWDEASCSLNIRTSGVADTRMIIWIHVPEGFEAAGIESLMDCLVSSSGSGRVFAVQWNVSKQRGDEIIFRFKAQ